MTRVVDHLLANCGLPRSEALLLLAAATGLRRERLIAGSRDPVPDGAVAAFDALARRRRAGEPVAYLLGWREFYGRRFAVDADVLIPRPETELLVDRALQWVDARDAAPGPAPRVLDLGTGTGAIAVTLALERPALDVVATDASAAALAVAARNAAELGARVRFLAGDWFAALAHDASPRGDGDTATFDLVVSNPPYVAAADPHLREGDLRFEPTQALTDFGDGLDAIRRIVDGVGAHLRPGGALMVEHGHDQGAAVRALMAASGLTSVETASDLAGIGRLTTGAAPGRPTPAGL